MLHLTYSRITSTPDVARSISPISVLVSSTASDIQSECPVGLACVQDGLMGLR